MGSEENMIYSTVGSIYVSGYFTSKLIFILFCTALGRACRAGQGLQSYTM